MVAVPLPDFHHFTLISSVALTPEEEAILDISLRALDGECAATSTQGHEVRYWGQVRATRNAYHIAAVSGLEGFQSKGTSTEVFFYTQNLLQWIRLKKPDSATDRRSILGLRQPFTGDPSALVNLQGCEILESDRLAFVVEELRRIVPRGAVYQTESSEVFQNQAFQGLTWEESMLLTSYEEYGEYSDQKKALPRQVFRTLKDGPEQWKIRRHDGKVVGIESIQWPGHTFFHVPGTAAYDTLYIGNGMQLHALEIMTK